MNAFPSLRIEGGFFSPDLVENLLQDQLPGQKAPDFGLPRQRDLTAEIAAVYHDARSLWLVFRNRLEGLPEDNLATSETRTLWVMPLMRLLGYDLEFQSRAFELDGLTFAISHILKSPPSVQHPTPVHIVGWRQELGRIAPSGRPRLSPHALVQEYLNRSEALWGIVTNGRILRLLRDSTSLRRQAYLEFDLEGIFEQERFADFVLLYRLLHRTRLPMDGRAEDCWLEKYYQQSIQQGGRVRDHLREGVEKCLTLLANGFLAHPDSADLRQWVQRERALALYRQLLRLVYRFLFLLVSEERGLMGQTPLYLNHYGISRLRRLVENRSAYTEDTDLWHGLRALWLILQDEQMAALLGVPPLNGELFTHQELDDTVITNRDLLEAFWHLAFYQENSAPLRRVNYAALDTEELGSVYESLLDYHPAIQLDSRGKPTFALTPGSERKSTGSYYTPPALVSELVKSALEPVIEERLAQAREVAEKKEEGRKKKEDPSPFSPLPSSISSLEQALLSIKVLDPACGSGHFLLAAARRLGKELARIRSGEDEPAPERVREATRDVVAHCIYGVDKNPLAVELARVALWLESHAEGKPLTFLDHRIKCGDSLVGVFDLDALKDGLPDEAFDPVTGDDRKLAAALKRQNKAERQGQLTFFGWNFDLDLTPLVESAQQIESIPDDSPQNVRRKRHAYEARLTDPRLRRLKDACDLWTAAFFQPLSSSPALPSSPSPITTDTVRRALAGQPVMPQTLAEAQTLAEENRFFHWPLEFPEVFASSSLSPLPSSPLPPHPTGFDVILGNPPWERIKLQEEEFFASRDAAIARAPNAAARKRLIADLPQTNPSLWQDYQRALHNAESASRFLRASAQYPLTGRGDINTYSVFAERVRHLLGSQGRAGIIVPTGIATDATNQFFFADLVEKGQLLSLFDFENREALFPGVHRSYKFCLLTLCGEQESKKAGEHETSPALTFSFFATRPEHLRDPRRVFHLSAADIARINPNTRTLPVFRTRQDADLTRAIYQRVPVLVNDSPLPLGKGPGVRENPWGVRFLAMFHMSNDSHLFRTRAELEAQGYRLVGNRFVPSSPSPISRSAGEGEYELLRAGRELIARARQLRREATAAERLLWEFLRDRRLLGRKFRRQHPIGQFIADFFCDDARLIIEIDGAVHREPTQQARDRLREEILREHGFAVLRFTDDQIFDRTEQVLREIAAYVTAHSYEHPSPGEGLLSQGFGRGSGGEGYLPLYEAKMLWHYDHRYGTYEGVSDRSSTQLPTPDERQHADPHFVVQPWYWVPAEEVQDRLGNWQRGWLLGFRDVTNATNERTAIFGLLPKAAVGNSLPVLLPSNISAPFVAGLVANFSTLPFDWVVRQKLGGVHMNFFYVEQFPVLPPDAYSAEDLRFIVPRVLELTYTAWDLQPFAQDVWNEADDPLRAAILQQEHESKGAAEHENSPSLPLSPFTWNEERRALLRAELDAYYARLYGLTRKQLRYILDPADLTERELADILDPWEEVDDPLDPQGYAARVAASIFPGETFRVLKEKEIRQYGEYRTRRLVLEAWEKL